jgi:hypothetical protein
MTVFNPVKKNFWETEKRFGTSFINYDNLEVEIDNYGRVQIGNDNKEFIGAQFNSRSEAVEALQELIAWINGEHLTRTSGADEVILEAIK